MSPPSAPIFVVGAFRSGTTLLRLILNHHSRIGIPPETHFVPDLYAQLGESVEPKRYLTALTAHARFADLELDPETIRRELPATQTSLARCLEQTYRLWARQRGKERWGDKTPCYVRRLDLLARLFPDLKALHIVRDGRDVAGSLLRMPWFDGGVVKAARRWNRRVRKGLKSAKRLGPERVLLVRYELLAEDPRKEIERCCEFLGEDFEEGMLQFHEDAERHVPSGQQDWHAETRRPLHGGRVGRWKKELSAREVRAFEDVAGPLLHRLDYKTVDPVGITALLRRLRWGRKGDLRRERTAEG